jgi:hypothetical protein
MAGSVAVGSANLAHDAPLPLLTVCNARAKQFDTGTTCCGVGSRLRELLSGIAKHLKPPGNRGDGAGTQEQRMHPPSGAPPGGRSPRGRRAAAAIHGHREFALATQRRTSP